MLQFRDLEDMNDLGLLSFDLELGWLVPLTGFDGISLSNGLSKLVSYRESYSLDSSRKFSIVLGI